MSSVPRLEYASQRKLRERNKIPYRFAHWPIWIFVFFLAPGPQTFRLFAYGWDMSIGLWLVFVIVVTGAAGLIGKLPGVEARPYIIRFTEDRPNPLYRRICYTVAWSEMITLTGFNLAGLIWAVTTGQWRLKQIYDESYYLIAGSIWVCGVLGRLPRVKSSTAGEGDERRYFYGTVWAALCAHPVLAALWLTLPRARWADGVKLAVFTAVLAAVGMLAVRGHLPRTRKIVPGELAISD